MCGIHVVYIARCVALKSAILARAKAAANALADERTDETHASSASATKYLKSDGDSHYTPYGRDFTG